jgi:hypothetical protein
MGIEKVTIDKVAGEQVRDKIALWSCFFHKTTGIEMALKKETEMIGVQGITFTRVLSSMWGQQSESKS